MKIVNTIAQRNAIPAADRADGMPCRVYDAGGVFFLRGGVTNAHWEGPFDWQTTADMEIYVNGGTGNDATGTGAVGAPYATITRAYKDVPHTLKHAVQIHIAAGTYTDFPTVYNEYYGDGQLSFDGVSDISNDSGSQTINTITQLGSTGMYDINVSGAAFTPNEFKEKLLKITSGTHSGKYAAVWSNTADTIRVLMPFSAAPAGSDTFQIGSPQIVVNLGASDPIVIEAKDHDSVIGLNSPAVSRVAIGFIKVTATNNVLQIKNSGAIISGCIFSSATDQKRPLDIKDSAVNFSGLPDNTKAFTLLDPTTYGMAQVFILENNGNSQKFFIDGENLIFCVSTSIILDSVLGKVFLYNCGIGAVDILQGALNAYGCYWGRAGTVSIQLGVGTNCRCAANYFGEGTDAIETAIGVSGWFNSLPGGTYSGYAVRMGPGSKLNCEAAITLTASTNELYFTQTSTASAGPAANNSITDNQGAYYIRS